MPKPVQPSSLTVDFSNVGDRREGGSAAHVQEGDYLAEVVGYEIRTKKDDETSKYISWRLHPIKGPQKTSGVIYHTTTLKEEGLWSLRNFLEDLGIKVPKSTAQIPLAKIVAAKKVIGITAEDDEYNGKIKSKVSATFKKADYEETGESADEDEEETEDEEEEVEEPAPKKKTKNPPVEEEDEDEDLEELDVDDI